MIISVRNLNGSLTLSTIHRGQRVSQTYYGYSERESRSLFRLHLTQLHKETAR